ncbi:hypothetical protein Q0L96_14490, partial [Staphylococcus aureus]|nr:hypothetical protein [Staphylococcus aureus]
YTYKIGTESLVSSHPRGKTALCFEKWYSETRMQDRGRENGRVGCSCKRGGFQKRERGQIAIGPGTRRVERG